MYLEERVEQLENLAVNQDKQIETVAKAVATLTVEVKQGFAELRQQQTETRQEVTRLADSQENIQQDVTRLADSQDSLHERFNQLDRKIDQEIGEVRVEMNQRFEQLDSKLDQLVTLIQDRLK